MRSLTCHLYIDDQDEFFPVYLAKLGVMLIISLRTWAQKWLL